MLDIFFILIVFNKFPIKNIKKLNVK